MHLLCPSSTACLTSFGLDTGRRTYTLCLFNVCRYPPHPALHCMNQSPPRWCLCCRMCIATKPRTSAVTWGAPPLRARHRYSILLCHPPFASAVSIHRECHEYRDVWGHYGQLLDFGIMISKSCGWWVGGWVGAGAVQEGGCRLVPCNQHHTGCVLRPRAARDAHRDACTHPLDGSSSSLGVHLSTERSTSFVMACACSFLVCLITADGLTLGRRWDVLRLYDTRQTYPTYPGVWHHGMAV